jgi:O-acetyl-ADP-ribose deacetylase (regulator of RNase III)
MKVHFRNSHIELVQGDITRQQVDAIVNAANAQLRVGGGVDGAIHRAAGPDVHQETSTRYPLGCPTGDAVPSAAGSLPAKQIFHAVGPVWRGAREGEPGLLRSCYRRCLELALQHGCKSLAFPAISTGVYAFPVDLAAENSLDEVRNFLMHNDASLAVRFVLFDAGTYAAFARVLDSFAE